MPQDHVIGGAGAGIPPIVPDASTGSGSPQAPAPSTFGRLMQQVSHAGERFNGLVVRPMKRGAQTMFGVGSSRSRPEAGGASGNDDPGHAATSPHTPPVVARTPSRLVRPPSLRRSPSSGSLSGGSDVDSDYDDALAALFDEDVEEPETPLVRRPRPGPQPRPEQRDSTESAAAHQPPPAGPSTGPATTRHEVPWPDGHVPDDAEISNFVTRFLSQQMPHETQATARKRLKEELHKCLSGMRDDALERREAPSTTTTTTTSTTQETVTTEPAPPASSAAPPPPRRPGASFMEMLSPESLAGGASGGGGADPNDFEKYQERAASLQMQAAKMQLNMSVVSAIADLVKTVGSKLESAASRG